MLYNLGGIIRLTYDVENDAEAPTNPSTATCVITQPDRTTTSPTVALPPAVVGELAVDFTPTQVGLHQVDWSTTVPTTSRDYSFTVEAPGMLVSVDEAIAHLRATSTINSDPDREQMQWLCLAATDAIERDLGRVLVPRPVTETHHGGQYAIILRQTPVVSITSVVDLGVTLTASDYLLDTSTGILYRGTTSYSARFTTGNYSVVITYVAGYANPPRVARLAALNLIQSMWQSSQQAAHPVFDESGAEAFATAAMPGLSQIPGYDSLRAAGVA